MRLKDLTGQKFGRLTVISRSPNIGKKAAWLCKCECGKESIVTSTHLMSGHTTSCGCYNKEVVSAMKKRHGMTQTKIYREWRAMISRCSNGNVRSCADYGGRGITVFARWANSFETYYDYVSKLPHFGEVGYSLNRIDNDGNYEPGNVEWADRIAQANNKRNNHLVTYNGSTRTLAEWAREKGITYRALTHRLERGWSIERALEMPLNNR